MGLDHVVWHVMCGGHRACITGALLPAKLDGMISRFVTIGPEKVTPLPAEV